jgi:TolB-like protein
MGALSGGDVFLFEGFRLDRQARVLFRRDEAGVFAPVTVGSRALEVLDVLVGRAEELVSRNEFMAAVWPCSRGCSLEPASAVVDPGPPVPRLSIVVLPFTNLSNDPDQQYLADGIAENLTTDLSRLSDMSVISRETAFTYRAGPVVTKRLAGQLNVRYVLEGSVQQSGSQIRINAQLIDAETDTHLWAERLDENVGDVLALENEITSRIAIALNLELTNREAARPIEHPDALDYIVRGRAAMSRPRSRATFAEAIGLFERAVALDPNSAEAQSLLAANLVGRMLDFGSSSEAVDVRRADELATRAVTASPGSALAHFAKGDALRARRRCAEAIPEYEAALSLNRNTVQALATIGRCKIYVGSIREGIAAQQKAISLSPQNPWTWIWYFRIGEGHLLQSRIDDAILWLEKARNANPAPRLHPCLPLIRLCAQRRERTRRDRIGGGPQAGWRGLPAERRPMESRHSL